MPPMIGSEDYALIKPYIILPMILSAFERDKKIIEESGVIKTPAPYVAMIDVAMDRVSADLREVKRQFRERGIKVHTIERGDSLIVAKFVCRGYTGTFNLRDQYLSAEAGVLMHGYLLGKTDVLAGSDVVK
ncbi:hypothetical protein [Brevibacillus reuszeri]|uniref:hypothetical protein n=1 Tax=Brevibacillus reuszeri TaxID=54915 RepID=UPI000CCC8454|nr:hypothetical protein [Brevibacillus reuszeri]